MDSFHPRMSYKIEKLKILVKRKYNKYKESAKKYKVPEYKKYTLINDIYNFISNYNSKYKTISLIIKSDNGDLSSINNIYEKDLETLFDFDDKFIYKNEDLYIKLDIHKPNIINELDLDDDTIESEVIEQKNIDNGLLKMIIIESHYKNENGKKKHLDLENDLTEFYSLLKLKSKMKIEHLFNSFKKLIYFIIK